MFKLVFQGKGIQIQVFQEFFFSQICAIYWQSYDKK